MALSIADIASVRTASLLRESDTARNSAAAATEILEALEVRQGAFLATAHDQGAHREELKLLLHGISIKTLAALVVGTVLAASLWLAVMWVVLRPLRELASAMSRVGLGGRLEERVNVGKDELLGSLAASFNAMLESLSRSTVSTQFLSRVLDSMNEMLVVLDQDRRVLRANRAFSAAVGKDADMLIDMPIDDLIVESVDGTSKQTLLRRDRHIDIPVSMTISELRQVEGTAGRYVLVANDIRERLSIEAALRTSQRRFNDFADSAADWFWEMDAELRFSFFSDRFEQVAGVKPERLLGKTRQETGIPDVDKDAWQAHLNALEHRVAFRDFVHPRQLDSGATVWLSINGTPHFDDEGVFRGFRGTGSDVTSRIEAVEAVRKAREAADESVRAKSNFLANVSHEIVRRSMGSSA